METGGEEKYPRGFGRPYRLQEQEKPQEENTQEEQPEPEPQPQEEQAQEDRYDRMLRLLSLPAPEKPSYKNERAEALGRTLSSAFKLMVDSTGVALGGHTVSPDSFAQRDDIYRRMEEKRQRYEKELSDVNRHNSALGLQLYDMRIKDQQAEAKDAEARRRFEEQLALQKEQLGLQREERADQREERAANTKLKRQALQSEEAYRYARLAHSGSQRSGGGKSNADQLRINIGGKTYSIDSSVSYRLASKISGLVKVPTTLQKTPGKDADGATEYAELPNPSSIVWRLRQGERVSEAELKQFLSEHSGWLSVNDNGEISIRKPQEPKWKSFGVDSKTGKLTGGRVEYGDGDGDGDRDRDGRTPLEQWSVRPLTLNR